LGVRQPGANPSAQVDRAQIHREDFNEVTAIRPRPRDRVKGFATAKAHGIERCAFELWDGQTLCEAAEMPNLMTRSGHAAEAVLLRSHERLCQRPQMQCGDGGCECIQREFAKREVREFFLSLCRAAAIATSTSAREPCRSWLR